MLLTSDSFETADLPLPLEIDAMRSPPTFRVFHALARYERFEEISDRRDFRNNYEEVGVIAADSLDDVFAATNDDRREYLESVRPGAEIRSTSVGDVIMEAWADERYGASVFNGSHPSVVVRRRITTSTAFDPIDATPLTIE